MVSKAGQRSASSTALRKNDNSTDKMTDLCLTGIHTTPLQGQHSPQTFGDEHSKLQKKTKMKVCDRFQVLEEITELCTKFNVLKMSSAQAVISHSLQTEFYKLLSTSLR